MQVPAQQRAQQGGLAYKWIVAIVIIFGIFMSVLDSTIVNIAIPRLQSAFGADLNSIQWVITGYILAQGVGTPLTPFLSGLLGAKRFYLIALGAFIVGSALCGLAWSLPVLIIFRVLQGLGGACLLPLSISLLYAEFPPEERGTALGLLGIPILLAPALGPTLGGYIVTYASWQLIFYINVLIGIVGIILAATLLRDPEIQPRVPFDLAGFVLSSAGLASLLYALSDASTDGWGSSKVLGFLFAGVLLLAIFVTVEVMIANRGGQPLLDMRVFGNLPFLTSNIASMFVTFALFGGLFLLPVYLESLRRLAAYEAGLILLPQALASMVGSVIGGRLVDRVGVRAVVIPGLLLLAIANWQLAYTTLYTPYGHLQFLLILRGLGLGACIQPLTVSALSTIQPRMLTQASTSNSVLRFVASSLGVALLATLVQTRTKFHYSHLAEKVTPASPLGQLVARLQAAFTLRGADINLAHNTAIQYIIQFVRQQAYMLAIQDAFWFTLIFTGIALVLTFFVRSRRRVAPVARPVAPEHPADDAEEARAGALLGA
ncbi:MAG: DHA2 family efflux MFS transporter permease subunit [Ktedonobacteraceae bacterium]